jgi:hypothetical protein
MAVSSKDTGWHFWQPFCDLAKWTPKSAGRGGPGLARAAPATAGKSHSQLMIMTSGSSKKRHRLNVDVEPGFETKLRLLAAKWGVKTNVALQRAVDLAQSRKWSEDEKSLLKLIAVRTEELLRHHVP